MGKLAMGSTDTYSPMLSSYPRPSGALIMTRIHNIKSGPGPVGDEEVFKDFLLASKHALEDLCARFL